MTKLEPQDVTDADERWRPPGFLQPPPALEARVLSAIANRSSPTRNAVIRDTAILTTLSWLATFGVFTFEGGVRITGRPWNLVLGTATGTALATAVVVWVALGPTRSSLPRARQILVPVVVCAPLAVFGWKLFWSSRYPGALDVWPTRPGFRCLALGLSMGLFPLLAFLVSRRGSVPSRPMLTGFAAGIAIGCVTTLLTDLWCPVAYLPHLLLGHVLPIGILGGLGASLGRRVIALRSLRS